MRMSREFFIPSKYSEKVEREGVQAEVYLTDGDNGPVAKGFGGKRSKPDFFLRFKSEERRQEYVDKYLDDLERRIQEKKARQEAKNNFEMSLKVGDILYSSWGYDQTNVDFYQVVELVGKKSVKIRAIGAMVDSSDFGADYLKPVKDKFLNDGDGMLKRVNQYNSVRIASYASASPYEGKPVYQTSYNCQR